MQNSFVPNVGYRVRPNAFIELFCRIFAEDLGDYYRSRKHALPGSFSPGFPEGQPPTFERHILMSVLRDFTEAIDLLAKDGREAREHARIETEARRIAAMSEKEANQEIARDLDYAQRRKELGDPSSGSEYALVEDEEEVSSNSEASSTSDSDHDGDTESSDDEPLAGNGTKGGGRAGEFVAHSSA